MKIGKRHIGPGNPCFIIAELSANHGQSFEKALAMIDAAKECGADAVKLQTYTPDTITLDPTGMSDGIAAPFHIRSGTIWDGTTLHKLYGKAFTPWDWQPRLKARAEELGMECFSSPFDDTAVEFLEDMGVSAYKIASFELVDVGLIERVARTGKPVIMSTGMATVEEIEEAVRTARAAGSGASNLALLVCSSSYPSPPELIRLGRIRDLSERFPGVLVGLSDHTPGTAIPVASVALGACIIEKHFILARSDGGPDAAFSLEPAEFRALVEQVRFAERALGAAEYGQDGEASSRVFRRSLFVKADVKRGEVFTLDNVGSFRPAAGLHTRHLREIVGKRATRDLERGTPLSWEVIE